MAYNDNFPEIFQNVKAGDLLGFYKKGFFQSIIPLATGYQANHCGICYNVQRSEDRVSFNFSEQTFSGGKFNLITIYRIGDKYICDNPYFVKQDKIYYRSLKTELTPEQTKIGEEDARNQVNQIYGYFTLIFGLKFWEKVLPPAINNWLGNRLKTSPRVCSIHAIINYMKMRVLTPDFKKDAFKDPSEVMFLNIYEQPKTLSNTLLKA